MLSHPTATALRTIQQIVKQGGESRCDHSPFVRARDDMNTALTLERPGFEIGKDEQEKRPRVPGSGSPSEGKSSPYKLPSYTSMSDSPSVAAGVPVLELVRKFEDEKILTRDDRVALNEALYSPDRREGVVKAMKDVELGGNTRFTIRRLKALIHQNGTGEMSSKKIKEQKEKGTLDQLMSPLVEAQLSARGENDRRSQYSPRTEAAVEEQKRKKEQEKAEKRGKSPNKKGHPSPTGGTSAPQSEAGSPSRRRQSGVAGSRISVDQASSILETQQKIEEVVGNAPTYVPMDHFNVCQKIVGRLRDFLVKYKPSAMGVRKFAVVVGSGSFNPLTRMHLRSYFVAKQYLEAKCGYIVLGSLLSPAHGMTVRERYRTNQGEIIPSTHRLAIAQMLVQTSKWLSIDPWEITRRRPLDYMSLLQHTSEVLATQFPDIDIKVIYLTKANAVPLMSPSDLRKNNFSVVSVCRATEFDMIRRTLSAKWNGLIHCVEDTAVLDASMDIVTSRKVRENMRKERSIETLAGRAIDEYVKNHEIGKKMNGEVEYADEEKTMPGIPSRPCRVYLKSQLMSMTSSTLGQTAGSLGYTPNTQHGSYTPSWSSPGNSSVNAIVSSGGAASALQKQRIHSSIPEPPSGMEGGMSPDSSRASPVQATDVMAPDSLASEASIASMPNVVASNSSLVIETTNL